MSGNDHAYELRELMENLSRAYEIVGETVRKALAGLELTPETADEPDRFEYTDDDGDSVVVRQGVFRRFVYVDVNNDVARLDQSAVNSLAQYLDRHRTDLIDPREPDTDAKPGGIKNPCLSCGHAPHGVGVDCGEKQLLDTGPYRCGCRGGA